MQYMRNGDRGAIQAMGTILAKHYNEDMVKEIMQMASNGDYRAIEAMGTIIKIRSKQQIDNDMRARVDQRNASATSSSEASSSRRAGESRSPERIRSGEGSSSQGEQWIDQVRRVLEEYPQMKERENKLKQERDQAQTQLTRIQQDLNRALEQLTKAEQERNQAQQSLNSTQEQLTITQQELAQTQEQLRQTQQVGERGQSSRGDSRANDALPTTVEGMQEQLGGERRRQQELFESVLRLQDGIQRTLLERGGDVPNNDRLNELLRQGIWNLVGYHRLDETLFPRQEFGELPSLRQRMRNFYLQTVSEYTTSLNLSSGQIAGEFVDQLEDQLRVHNRPDQEYIDTSEDIQEGETGIRPNHTRR
jgi:myosin heavy subunit